MKKWNRQLVNKDQTQLKHISTYLVFINETKELGRWSENYL